MKKLAIIIGLLCSTSVFADKIIISMYDTENNAQIGTITATDVRTGVKFTPALKALPPGEHGMHIHVAASCADEGMAAGGHLDPDHTNKHQGPNSSSGHLGDLPYLTVDKNGVATTSVIAPRLKVSALHGHALIIHAGGDNYSDKPLPLGGGGARIACGVIK